MRFEEGVETFHLRLILSKSDHQFLSYSSLKPKKLTIFQNFDAFFATPKKPLDIFQWNSGAIVHSQGPTKHICRNFEFRPGGRAPRPESCDFWRFSAFRPLWRQIWGGSAHGGPDDVYMMRREIYQLRNETSLIAAGTTVPEISSENQRHVSIACVKNFKFSTSNGRN